MTIVCGHCQTPLVLGKNWWASSAAKSDYVCTACCRQRTSHTNPSWKVNPSRVFVAGRYVGLTHNVGIPAGSYRTLEEAEAARVTADEDLSDQEIDHFVEDHPPHPEMERLLAERAVEYADVDRKWTKRIPQGYVYVIVHDAFENQIAIGKTSNIKKRLAQYHTAVPDRGHYVHFRIYTEDANALEKAVMAELNSMGLRSHPNPRSEWFDTNRWTAEKLIKQIARRLECEQSSATSRPTASSTASTPSTKSAPSTPIPESVGASTEAR